MERPVKLSRIEPVLDTLDYPVTRTDAAAQLSDVTLQLADGETNLGEAIAVARSDAFGSVDDLETALFNVLPIEALGEPGQSDGDA